MPLLFVQRRVAGADEGVRPLLVCALPSGALGVLCEGLVYALRDGYYIELNEEGFYLSDCSPISEFANTPAPAVENLPRYRCDSVGSKLRICFDGPSDLLGDVVGLSAQIQLRLAGFGRWIQGLSSEATVNGNSAVTTDIFAWFVEFEGPRLPSNVEVANLFFEASRRGGEFLLPSEDALSLRAEISLRDQQLAFLHAQIEEQNEQVAADALRLVTQVDVMQAALSRYRGLLEETEKQRRTLSQSLDRLVAQNQPPPSLSPQSPTRNASDLEVALNNWQQSDAALANAKAELVAAAEELEALKGNLRAVEKAHAGATGGATQLSSGRKKSREKDIETAFGSLLPNLIPVGDSIPFLAENVFNLRPLLVLLKRINDVNMSELPRKKVRGAEGWFESHFSTGQSDDGRVYYCWGNGTAGKSTRVLISNKRRQVLDIERLACS